MTTSLMTSVLLGLDGFAACLALRLLGLNPSIMPLAAWCGLCDGLALLAGGVLSQAPFTGSVVWPLLIGAWAALVGVLMVWRMNMFVFLLPLLLALDNLLFGAAMDQPSRIVDAGVSGIVSAGLAAAGLFVGGMMADYVGQRHARLAGAGILLATGFAALGG